jgi:tripartite-type tricarboxylate transporter receptor subunit TctC
MPPGVPDDIYQAWKHAFEATVRDPGFLEGAKVAGVEVGLATAEDFAKVIQTYRGLSPAGRDVFKRLVGES